MISHPRSLIICLFLDACANVPCRILVIVLCGILILVGFVFFVLGCILTWAESTVYSYIRTPVDSYLKFAKLSSDSLAKATLLNAVLDYTEPIGQMAFWVGLCMILICGVGFYGAIIKNKFWLFLFCSMLLAKILILVVIIVTFHTNPKPVVDTFQKMLYETVRGYKGIRSPDKHSLLLNVMMPFFDCCGVTGGEDFTGSKTFDKTFVHEDSVFKMEYPFPCCKMSSYERLPSECPQLFDERNSNVKRGCWPRLEGHILEILTKISYVVIFTTMMEVSEFHAAAD
ncbi:uncharacterized protein DEA37_0011580 [Paragonimus westermani]|uniref:Tetraspanin n=1 Tax=Paragonimus westermani TaxID=34504 RepID=A0A5J4NRH8_9TREM|nr:uncharacterized protein DEA37_0011580 [Paragonimus westermani]